MHTRTFRSYPSSGSCIELAEHLPQKIRPQFRQWCRRRTMVNGASHAVHWLQSWSGTQRTPKMPLRVHSNIYRDPNVRIAHHASFLYLYKKQNAKRFRYKTNFMNCSALSYLRVLLHLLLSNKPRALKERKNPTKFGFGGQLWDFNASSNILYQKGQSPH